MKALVYHGPGEISLEEVEDPTPADNEVLLLPGEVGWTSRLNELPVLIDTLVVAGSIRSSLYSSVMALDAGSMSQQERIEQFPTAGAFPDDS